MDGKKDSVEGRRSTFRLVMLILLSILALLFVGFAVYTVVLSFLSLSNQEESLETIGDMTTGKTFADDDKSIQIAQTLDFDYNSNDMPKELSWLELEGI